VNFFQLLKATDVPTNPIKAIEYMNLYDVRKIKTTEILIFTGTFLRSNSAILSKMCL